MTDAIHHDSALTLQHEKGNGRRDIRKEVEQAISHENVRVTAQFEPLVVLYI